MSNAPLDDSPLPRLVTGLAKIGMVLKNQAWKQAGAQGLSPTQGQILALLARHPEGQRLSDLATALGITAATTSDAVRVLVEKGLVRRDRSPQDARALLLTLTAEGQREAERSAAWPDMLLEAAETLSPTEQAVFLRALVKMLRNLQERGLIPVQRMCVSCQFFRPNVHDDLERRHHCALLDVPFGDRALRLDCPEHDLAEPREADAAWERFVTSGD